MRTSAATLRPALHLLLLVAAGALSGTALLTLQAGADMSWVDRAARSVEALHGNEGLNRLMVGITSVGEEIVLFGLFGGLALIAYRRSGVRWGRFFALVGAGALVLDNVIKPLVGRPRPVFDQLVGGRGDSFPSGHVTATTALLFSLAWYLSTGKGATVRKLVWCAAGGGAIVMAVSRVYLGVHWPTDVLAGLVLGAAWVCMCASSQLAWSVRRPARLWTARKRALPLVATLVLVGVACSPSADDTDAEVTNTAPATQTVASAGGEPYEVDIRPEDFVAEIDNPYFPLVPGTTFKLKGETEDGIERETITVTDRKKEVMGVTTTVVKDVARVDGDIAEFTYDWYAQDKEGNVWYFGENTAEMENGKILNRHGSWEAGVDGALPGIIMNADPQVLDSFRQEYYAGEAEDMYWIVADNETVSPPAGTFHDAIRVLEWNPLEPGVVGQKFYAPGVGLVSERALSGGKEIVELLSVTGP
jgi:membrane-associated phospholipid phosphatase